MRHRLLLIAGHLLQVAAYRIEPVVARELIVDGFQQVQSRRRSLDHRQRDRPVERDDRIAGQPFQFPVPVQDLWPVGLGGILRVVMQRRDGCLRLILADRVGAQCRRDQPYPLADLPSVPQFTALARQRNQLTVRSGAGGTAGVGQQHQREQPGNLAVGRDQRVQHPGEPDGLGGKLRPVDALAAAARVPLVEDQVQHAKYGAQPRLPLLHRRHREAGARQLDTRLGAADPLRHRRLRHQKG